MNPEYQRLYNNNSYKIYNGKLILKARQWRSKQNNTTKNIHDNCLLKQICPIFRFENKPSSGLKEKERPFTRSFRFRLSLYNDPHEVFSLEPTPKYPVVREKKSSGTHVTLHVPATQANHWLVCFSCFPNSGLGSFPDLTTIRGLTTTKDKKLLFSYLQQVRTRFRPRLTALSLIWSLWMHVRSICLNEKDSLTMQCRIIAERNEKVSISFFCPSTVIKAISTLYPIYPV